MRNHDEKRRDMCRSILPSTARKTARHEAALLKRKHRRQVRGNLRDWAAFADPYEYEGFACEDTNRPINGGSGWAYPTMKEVVLGRQAADKVAPLVRWVEAIKDGLPGDDDEEKFEALRALLPDNLIGRHALSHVDQLFDLPSMRYFPRRRWDEEAGAAKFLDFVDEVRAEIIRDHQYINDVFRGRATCYGLHDVDRFATFIARDQEALALMERIISGERVKTGTFAFPVG